MMVLLDRRTAALPLLRTVGDGDRIRESEHGQLRHEHVHELLVREQPEATVDVAATVAQSVRAPTIRVDSAYGNSSNVTVSS
jgi:hypothetical protein